jgi:type I restriction enzyme S subunit
MNKIEKLIAELCPQGVEFKRLGEITREYNLRNKDGFIKEVRSVTNKIGLVSTDDYFNNKRTSQDTSNYKVVKPNMFVYNPARINIGSIALLKEKIQVIVSPMYVVFEIDKSKIIPEYLDLFISSESGKYQILNRVEVGARFRLPYESLSKIEIPLPPLVIQQKIVSILDKFTQLEAELEAELVLRKKQYEYYRNQLLTPINVNGQWLLNGKKVEWKKMGEIGEFYSGISGKNKNDVINGNAKFITYLNVYSNIAINTNIDTFVKIDENENQNKIEYGDVLFTGSSETLEEC